MSEMHDAALRYLGLDSGRNSVSFTISELPFEVWRDLADAADAAGESMSETAARLLQAGLARS